MLGVGTGWMQAEHDVFGLDLPPLGERFDRLFETLSYLRAAFGSDQGFSGEYYQLDPIEVLPRPVKVPIVVGGGGPKRTPAYAGRFADEYNMFVTDAETVRQRLGVMSASAVEAGRSPDAVEVSFAGPVVVAPDEASYRAKLEARGARRDQSAHEYEAFLAEHSIPHGTPDRARQSIATLAELGVSRYYVQEYRDLADVDTDSLETAFDILRS